MGNQWATGNRQWAMGNGHWALGIGHGAMGSLEHGRRRGCRRGRRRGHGRRGDAGSVQHLGHLGHGPWADKHTSAPALELSSINFIHAMQIRHGPDFYGSGSDMQICRHGPGPTGPAEPGSPPAIRHPSSRRTLPCGAGLRRCKRASVHPLAHSPAAAIPPPSHPPPWHHQPTARPPPWHQDHQPLPPLLLKSSSDTHPDPQPTLRHSPIRPDGKAEPPLARLDVRLGKQDLLSKLINRMARGALPLSSNAGPCAMLPTLPTLRSERARSQMDKFEVKVSTRKKRHSFTTSVR